MDQAKFTEAQSAYNAGDFRTAAKLFLAAAGKGPAGNGAAYHMAGNSLMRLRRHQDAVTVYGHALRDDMYAKRGAVYANLGAAYVAVGEYAQAAGAYESALEEPGYATPYKALQGLAAALIERGRIEEAAASYRRAALDEQNPDPGKALVNLGLCFMALNRPSDAVEAYKAALGFDAYQGRGKALANLGQAYLAAGQPGEAVKAFEKATQLHSHRLSPAAQAAYDQALASVLPKREVVDGWETGEMPAIPLGEEPQGWDTAELQALTGAETGGSQQWGQPSQPAQQHMQYEQPTSAESAPYVQPALQPIAEGAHAPGALDDAAEKSAAELGFGDEQAVNDFFALTEEEMRVRDREMRKQERARRGSGNGLVRLLLTVVVVIVLLAGGVAAAWWFGFGWPTQDTTVNAMLTAYSDGRSVEQYWVAVPERDMKREMAKIPFPLTSFTLDGVAKDRSNSTARITVTPEKGAPLHYSVALVREGVGWKVAGIENDWRTTGGQ